MLDCDAWGVGSSSSSWWVATARAQEADFSVEAIRKRIEILRPDLEAVLGAPLGDPVEVVVTTPDALKE